jgi:prepilin-type N-terminal cleavage/methylation domain-containing protein/prepilin-type processing-associated H-X9-DG protein
MKSTRSGFSLLELLIAMSIISLLMALLLPAIQHVRAAADRISCASNLRQIGIALHHFHTDFNRFPPGYTPPRPKEPNPRITWLARLLPYIEQDILWKETLSAYAKDKVAFNVPPHTGFLTPIKLYSCPVDERLSQAQLTIRGRIAALTSYVGVLGTDYRVTDGVLYKDSKTRIPQIYDGSSNTIMVGERPPSADNFYGWWYAGFGQNGTGSLDMLLGARERNFGAGTTGSLPPGPYEFGPGRLDNLADVFHFWSLHPGGAHFLFADGSTHFLAYNISPTLLPALATRNGRETETLE